MTKVCVWCGETFDTEFNQTKFCSKPCQRKSWKDRIKNDPERFELWHRKRLEGKKRHRIAHPEKFASYARDHYRRSRLNPEQVMRDRTKDRKRNANTKRNNDRHNLCAAASHFIGALYAMDKIKEVT